MSNNRIRIYKNLSNNRIRTKISVYLHSDKWMNYCYETNRYRKGVAGATR